MYKKNFCEFIAGLDFINKFRNEHLKQVKWNWKDRADLGMGEESSYINQVLVRRIGLGS